MEQEKIINKIQKLYSKEKYKEIIDYYLELNSNKEIALKIFEITKTWNNTAVRPELTLFQGILCYYLNEYKKGLNLCNKAIELDPTYVRAYNNKGNFLANLGEYTKAIDSYDKAIELDLEYASPYGNKGSTLINLEEYEKAIEYFNKAIELDPKDPNYYYNKGLSLFNLEEYEKAIEYFDKAIELDPKNVDVYKDKADTLAILKEYEQAIECFDKAIELDPKDANFYYNKGLSLFNLEEYEKAIEYFDKAIELDQKNVAFYKDKADTLAILKEYEKAIDSYEKAIELDSENVDILNTTGYYWDKLKDYEKALKYYNKAIELDPKFKSTYINKGVTFYNKKQYQNAVECYDKAIELDQKYGIAYNNKGNALDKLKEYEKALESYDKAIELDPEDPKTYNNKGITLNSLKDYEKAIENYEKAIELNPAHPTAYAVKGYALIQLNLQDEAISNFNDFLKRSSNSYLNDIVKEEIKELQESHPEINNLKKQIEDVKVILRFDGDSITHYTGLIATQILTMDEKSSFRMSEANYMNDTAEGEKLKGIVLEPLNSDNQSKISFIEKPFLASFVDQEKCNDLTLWRMYTKSDGIDGKGCAITLKTDTFLQNLQKTLTSTDDEDVLEPGESLSRTTPFENEFCLYRVAYLDEENICLGEKKQRRLINKALKEIKNVFKNIKGDDSLVKMARERLSEIEYLFKGAEYQHESEVRLILSKTGKQKHIKIDEEMTNLIPRTYLNTGNIIESLDSITIGPKVERPKEWAAALNYKLQELEKEEVSIYISQLPYK